MAAALEESPVETTSFEHALNDAIGQIKVGGVEEVPFTDDDDDVPVKPEPKAEKKPVEQPKPEVKEATRPQEKPAPKAEEKPVDQKSEKEKRKFDNLTPEKTEFLRASDVRRLEVLEARDKRIKELEDELGPAKELAAKLPEEKQRLETEVVALRAEKEAILKEKAELSGKVTAYDVRQSDEYAQNVRNPWNKTILGDPKLMEGSQTGPGIYGLAGFDRKSELHQIVQTGDEAALEELLQSVPSERMKARINAIFDEGQKLIEKDREYAAKGPEALKEIQERKTRAERETQEKTKKEREGYFGEVDAQATRAFGFLAGEEGNEGLNSALKQAKEKMTGFEWNSLSPQEQAFAAHQLQHAPIIFAVQGQKISQLSKENADMKTAHAEEVMKKDAEIEKLNERLGNTNGSRLNAGSGKSRADNGQFTGEAKSAEDLFESSLRKAKQGS